MLTTTEFAKRFGVSRRSIIRACNRGEIAGAVRTDGHSRGRYEGRGEWRIPPDAQWTQPRLRPIDGSDFNVTDRAPRRHEPRADVEDKRELRRFASKHAAPEAVAEAMAWMRRNARKLPQLRRDPVIDNAVREHDLIG